jgi:hypothetical protein
LLAFLRNQVSAIECGRYAVDENALGEKRCLRFILPKKAIIQPGKEEAAGNQEKHREK